MVDALPYGSIAYGGVHHPVNHVAAVVVEERGLGFDMGRGELCANLYGLHLLGLQVRVGSIAL